MAEISIGSAVGAGFGLIARKPLTVMAWGLVRVLFAAVVLAVYAPMMLSIFAAAIQAQAQGQSNPGAEPSQAVVAQMLSHIMVVQGLGYLAQLVGLLLGAVIYCAICRAIVHPERGGAAYLRLGGPEFFVAVLSFAAGIAAAFAILIGLIPFIIVIAILAAQKLFVAMAAIIVLCVLVLVAALIYVLLRFAFVIPMMVDDGQFHLFDAWSLTKGHVGSLFAIGLCLFGIAIGAELILGVVFFALVAAAIGMAGGPQSLQTLFALGPAAIAARLAPWLIVGALLAIPLEGCGLAIFLAPWARAYRDVAPPPQPAAAAPPPTIQPSPAPA